MTENPLQLAHTAKRERLVFFQRSPGVRQGVPAVDARGGRSWPRKSWLPPGTGFHSSSAAALLQTAVNA